VKTVFIWESSWKVVGSTSCKERTIQTGAQEADL
jgi:hypothetical protein